MIPEVVGWLILFFIISIVYRLSDASTQNSLEVRGFGVEKTNVH